MAQDEFGNEIPQQQQGPNWEDAAGEINRWKDQNNPGGNINWEAARSAFDSSGGDLNKVYGQKGSWLSSAAPQAQAQPFDYEGFRTGWLTAGFGNKTSPEQIAQHAKKWGVTIRGGDKAYDPQGNFIADLAGDIGGKSTLQFLRGPEGHATAGKYSGKAPKGKAPKGKAPKVVNSHGPGSGAPPTAPPGPPPPVAPPPPPPPPPTPPADPTTESVAPIQDPRLTALYEQLLARSKQGLDVENDPVIRAQTDSFRAEQERARRNYISDLAERSGPGANLLGEQRLAAERVGQSTGNLRSELMGREVQARRDEIQQALNQTQELLTEEQRLALQNELARLNDATQRYGIDVGASTSRYGVDVGASTARRGQDFGERASKREDATRRYGIDTEDNQFRDRLGFDYGDRSNYWDAINRGIL